MKKEITSMKIILIISLLVGCKVINAQDTRILFKPIRPFTPEEEAQFLKKDLFTIMEEQIDRTLNSLKAGNNIPKPFYTGLNVTDRNRIVIHSTLGFPVKSEEQKIRNLGNIRVLIGDYEKNNLNSGIGSDDFDAALSATILPNGTCKEGFRRKIRMGMETTFRHSVKAYAASQASSLSNLSSEWANLPDFIAGPDGITDLPPIHLSFKTDKLVNYANEASSLFKNDGIFNSWVKITGYKQNTYYLNSEGKRACYPGSVFRLALFAETLANDGEKLEVSKLFYFNDEDGLPGKEIIASEIKDIINLLSDLKTAPVFDEVYTGPVLFSGQAALEMIRKSMFSSLPSQERLIAKRITNANSNQGTLTEDRIGTKISSLGLNVKALAGLREFNKVPLIGFYPVDADGIEPQEVTLIENGILKNLLCGRIPTLKMSKSNGHCRLTNISNIPYILPGIIEVGYSGGKPYEELKTELLEIARSEGLNYALVVKELSTNFTETKRAYKVDVNTGKETLVRSSSFNNLKFSDLRKLVAASNQIIVMNTSVGEDIQPKFDFFDGVPASIIMPDALLFREIEVTQNSRRNMAKLPVVKNPMEL